MVTLVKEMAVPEVMRAPQIPQYCCFLADSGIRAVAIFPGVLGAWMQVPWLRIAPLATCQRVRTHKIRTPRCVAMWQWDRIPSLRGISGC
jgi:hypothetical protein